MLYKAPHKFVQFYVDRHGRLRRSDVVIDEHQLLLLLLKENVGLISLKGRYIPTEAEEKLIASGEKVCLPGLGSDLLWRPCKRFRISRIDATLFESSAYLSDKDLEEISEMRKEWDSTGEVSGSLFLAPNLKRIWFSHYDVKCLIKVS